MCIVSWVMTASGDYLYVNNKKVMEVIMVRRKDNGKLALPGGFILPEGMLRVMYSIQSRPCFVVLFYPIFERDF